MLAQASRLNFSTRLFNLIVTNVPGPQFPLYASDGDWSGRSRSRSSAERHALAVAVMCYYGKIGFGLFADFDAIPDLEAIGLAISAELQRLVELARGAAGG